MKHEVQSSHASATESAARSAEELLHELRVQQIELEMQNEELRRVYDTLKESHERQVALCDFAPVGLLILTCEGLIAEINLTAANLLGLDRRKLLYSHFTAFVTAKDGNSWYLFFSDIMRHNERQNIELTLRRCDGSEFPVRLDCLPGDKDSMLRMTLTDMTGCKRTEEFRTLADNSPEMIARYGRDCRYIYVNPAYRYLTGISLETAPDKPPDEDWKPLIPYKEYLVRLNSVMETGEADRILLEWYEPDGRLISHNMHAVAEYDQQGHVISVLIMGHNITELKETERYLEESRAQLRIFTAKREDARAEERKRIAREVHDELGQLLSVLRLNIMTLNFHFGDTIPGLRDKTHKMTNIVDLAIMIVRNLATRLRPAVLNAGIVSALECMTREYSQNTDIKCRLHILTRDVPLNEEQSIMVFRIVQESLTNVLRHSGAARVDIYLRRKGDVFELEVSDNGNGFEMLDSIRRSSYGIAGMQERALILGGRLDIVSEPGGGTVLKLQVPLAGLLQKPQCR